MNHSPIVRVIVRRLEKAKYVRLALPLRVAAVDFDFTEALRGSGARSFDLVIIVNAATGSFGDTDATKVRNRIQALSRALDITGSRFTLTLLFVGSALGSEMKLLAETCRVLHISVINPSHDDTLTVAEAERLEDEIRVLLPLELPDYTCEEETNIASTLDHLNEQLPKDNDPVLMHDIISASYRGKEEVQRALGKRIDDVLGILEEEK